MAGRVVLHVGCLKSGTSYVQRVLDRNREALAAQGFLFPGATWRRQVAAVIDVRGHRRDGRVPADAVGAWDELRTEIAAWPGTAVVSMEFLATTPRAAIRRIVDSLAPARVEAVLTVRDLGRTIPSMWQESVKNGETDGWAEFAAAVRDGDPRQPGPARRFWRHQAATPIARRWSRGVGADAFTLVTVPPAGARDDVLWQRFCEAVGLDPHGSGSRGFDLGRGANQSLGAASAEVIRTLNERLGDALPTDDYNRLVKRLAKRGLAPRRDREPSIVYAEPWLDQRAQAMIDGLANLGVRVVGDLEDLRPRVGPATVATPDDLAGGVPAKDRLSATVDAIAFELRVWPIP